MTLWTNCIQALIFKARKRNVSRKKTGREVLVTGPICVVRKTKSHLSEGNSIGVVLLPSTLPYPTTVILPAPLSLLAIKPRTEEKQKFDNNNIHHVIVEQLCYLRPYCSPLGVSHLLLKVRQDLISKST